jgi:hypothetical protein
LVTQPQAVAVAVVGHQGIDEALDALLYERYGVGDLADVEGATDRVVELSEASNVACPMHDRLLMPDACRSCRFLAGEVRP